MWWRRRINVIINHELVMCNDQTITVGVRISLQTQRNMACVKGAVTGRSIIKDAGTPVNVNSSLNSDG